ncbi:MAG: DUF2029 domain-containing protein [Bdellovibrionales bacterium]|nr:DUF2029 domain-containing protein [Bdellovibrionales bacterium]
MFVISSIRQYHREGLFYTLGMDYRVYRATARIVAQQERPYNWSTQQSVQLEIAAPHMHDSYRTVVGPMLYPPVMLWAFYPLEWFSPESGFYIWTLATLLLSLWYLKFYASSLGIVFPGSLLLVSIPSLSTFYYGQISVLLLVAGGEWLRCAVLQNPSRSGAAAAGLFVKPQLLPLIALLQWLVAPVRSRRWFIGSLFILVLLCLRSGDSAAWLMALRDSLFSPDPSISVEYMPNVRSLIADIVGPHAPYGGPLALVISVFLVAAFFYDILRATKTPVVLHMIRTLLLTCMLSWHFHIHSAVIALPALLLLSKLGTLMRNLVVTWLVLPSLIFGVLGSAGNVYKGLLLGRLPLLALTAIIFYLTYRKDIMLSFESTSPDFHGMKSPGASPRMAANAVEKSSFLTQSITDSKLPSRKALSNEKSGPNSRLLEGKIFLSIARPAKRLVRIPSSLPPYLTRRGYCCPFTEEILFRHHF